MEVEAVEEVVTTFYLPNLEVLVVNSSIPVSKVILRRDLIVLMLLNKEVIIANLMLLLERRRRIMITNLLLLSKVTSVEVLMDREVSMVDSRVEIKDSIMVTRVITRDSRDRVIRDNNRVMDLITLDNRDSMLIPQLIPIRSSYLVQDLMFWLANPRRLLLELLMVLITTVILSTSVVRLLRNKLTMLPDVLMFLKI